MFSPLDNVKIATKIAALVVMASVVGILVSVYAESLLGTADVEYSALIDHESTAQTLMVRSDRNINQIGYNAYRVISNDGQSQQAKDAAAKATTALADALSNMSKAAVLLPGQMSDIESFKQRATATGVLADEAIKFGLANDTPSALRTTGKLDPLINSLGTDIRAFNQALATAVKARTQDLSALASANGMMMLGGASLTALFGVVLALLVSAKGITGPLSRLRETMGQLASGKLDVLVEGTRRGDEVGQMAKTVEVFKANALRARQLEADAEAARTLAATEAGRTEAMRRKAEADQKLVVGALAGGLAGVAEGDLTTRLDQGFPEDYVQLQNDFNAAVAKLALAIGTVSGSVHGMKSQTDEIAAASDDMSRRTEQQAAALEETAAALNEITTTVRRTADGARQAAEVTERARKGAQSSGEVVKQAVEAMGRIEASAGQIGRIIGVIDEIAFQTNLLALNAGVEAARAGEAGRGFAVVAQEVRALAQRSADAAKEIKTLIQVSSHEVEQGVALVGHTGEALSQLVDEVAQLNALVTEIASSAKEQATGLAEVNTAINQMDQVTQQNAAMVEQSTAANRALAQEAVELTELMSQFRAAEPQAGGRRAPERRAARPAQRPAARTMSHGSGGGGTATARKLEVVAKDDSWEEF